MPPLHPAPCRRQAHEHHEQGVRLRDLLRIVAVELAGCHLSAQPRKLLSRRPRQALHHQVGNARQWLAIERGRFRAMPSLLARGPKHRPLAHPRKRRVLRLCHGTTPGSEVPPRPILHHLVGGVAGLTRVDRGAFCHLTMSRQGRGAEASGGKTWNVRRIAMARWLKRGMDASAIKAADAKVRETVEGILAEVEERKDLAIRELSEKFDKWSPADFRLSPAEIERAIARGAAARPRRHQVRPGAGAQLRAEAEGDDARPRGRDAARRRARPSPHPGERHRLLRAGRALSHGRLGAHVDRHGQGRRRAAHHRLRPALQGRAASRHRRRHALRRRGRDLRARRRAGGGRHGARHRDHPAGGHDRRPRQRLRGGGQAPAVRPRRHRPAGRADRDADHRRRLGRRRDLRHRPARARPSTGRPRPP